MRYVAIAAAVLSLAACDGPKEQTGEAQDRANANAAGVEYEGNGPAERTGEAQDRAEKAARESVDARQDQIKTEADTQADKLEEQAKQLRDEAKARAEAVGNATTTR
ncbi:hypothetical protein [Sphingomonas sp. CFBP 8760]|uniref:hypothetical protein n=1 Tax=Sphingomonas sp. CFBP 8760 TaxID=2775282 RepID=UPI0017849AB0|nr:hypothetical protein [Sphingomonas sp. CFBP 8760]MBD8546810.1 hypothetical protein [Sphingomonas sp. CFBP 8760]